MKKYLLAISCLCIGQGLFAQKSNIRLAETYLEDGSLDKAKTAIDEAVNNESTKDNVRAWYVRGTVYLKLQIQKENERFYPEAGKSLKRAVTIQQDYEPADINNKLLAVAIYNFNDGLTAYDKQQYNDAFNMFGEVVSIHDMDGGKRFTNMPKFDTIAHQSSLYQGYSAYYNNKYDDALPLLLKAKTSPIVKSPSIYLMIADIYEAKKDDANLITTVGEGKKAFPADKGLSNRELNYYIKSGKSDQLISKLEESVKAEPNNAEFHFIIGQTYDGMANPKDNTGKDLPKPSNYTELFDKADAAYKKTLAISPNNGGYNYNEGALYFNRSVMINDQMNAVDENSAAGIKKYETLKKDRDEWFGKALPYLEKAIGIWEPSGKSLKGEDAANYQSALMATRQIYAILNKPDKVKEMNAKLEAFQK